MDKIISVLAVLGFLWLLFYPPPMSGDAANAGDPPPVFARMNTTYLTGGGSLECNRHYTLLSAHEYELPDCTTAISGCWVIVSTFSALVVEIGVPAAGVDTIFHGRISPALDQYDELDSPGAVPGETISLVCNTIGNGWNVFGESGLWVDGGVPD